VELLFVTVFPELFEPAFDVVQLSLDVGIEYKPFRSYYTA